MSQSPRKTLNLALAGADGRMGREIQALIAAEPGFSVVAEINAQADWAKVPPSVDVVVDFSTPEGLAEAIAWCERAGKPLVSGTTGFAADVEAGLKRASVKIPILHSGNMSLGIAVMAAMLDQLRAVTDWDFEIEEAHHNQKKDKPSGTALLLKRKLASVIGREQIPTHSIRGGGIPGVHQVFAMGPEETVTLQHTAFNRRVFARGALRAARWLFDKGQPGLYDLSDLYKVN